jgi:TPR repeat protein
MKDNDIIKRKFENVKSAEDLYDLAQCYEYINQFGNPNPYFNNFRRLYWYLKSGNYGYAEAFNNLGFIIEHELNVKNKNERALKYYKKAFDLGSKLGEENYLLSINGIFFKEKK